MPKAIEIVLKSVGLPDEDVKKIAAIADDDTTFDANPFTEKIKGNYQTQFKNDPEFFKDITVETLPPSVKKAIESAQYARSTNESKGKIAKALGFDAEEIKDLESDDFKPLDRYISAITDKWTKSKSGSKEVQEQLIAERKKNEEFVKKYGPDYEKEVETKYQKQSEEKETKAIISANMISELSAIPGLKVKASTLAREANDILNSKYAFERVGEYSVELRQKGNPAMKVLKNGSSEELTLKDALSEIAEKEGWIEKEKDSVKGSGTVTAVVPANGQLKMQASPHVATAIQKKIDSEKDK